MKDDLLYEVALTMIPDLGPIRAKLLVEHFGDAASVFIARKKDLAAVEGIGEICARKIRQYTDLSEAEAELVFMQKHHVQPLFITHKNYPQRLLHCYDPPAMLYYRGNADLNTGRIVSIIGTRHHTDYGKQVTEELIAALETQNILVVSGLAFGIDSIAHKAALQNGLQTVGVLAHGMDSIYPSQNKMLARDMLLQGGLLTEFRRNTKPDKHNFPKRNRIVAGMADATIVIETASKGGSMITAELAHNYNRDLFAVPGKITDHKSSGCLQLIRQHKAMLLTGAGQLMETMGWQAKKNVAKKQRELFIELTEDEKKIVQLLKEKDMLPIDLLYLQSGLSASSMAAAMLNLEMQNLVCLMPGKMYRLV
ncbi:DNA-protecting protein DprA [Sediminibacterium roseum]|uniref:DNA-protecting protein DprA n=1 Tax=Sediminibacterium roseum TaxID=1978412 RepID=A0ABW9ZZQ5_9BACT|nr:DNA-processing protein DprA [Sediminibacterium roseum]NCI51523.1 DNA-protecting protein DprA [Sediminibacterium roseum]